MTHIRFPNPVAFDLALVPPIFSMMERGFRISIRKREEFKSLYTGQLVDLQGKLNSVAAGALNVNSPPQVKEFFYHELGLPPRRYKGQITVNEAALRGLMANCRVEMERAKTPDTKLRYYRGFLGAMFVIKIRGVRKALSSYINIPIDVDGRMRTTLAIGKTETGRFSASKTLWGTGCNLQTIPKKLRTLFLADDDKEIAEFDLNRGESWVYAHLAEDPTMMAIHQEGRDFHAETAVAISVAFSARPWTVESLIARYHEGDSEAYKLRFLGKKINHASAYRMGPHKAADEINKEADDTGITVSVAQARAAQDLWREKYPNIITKWWPAIERKLNLDRTLVTPYGRRRVFYGFLNDELYKEATAYVPQGTCVDHINLGILRVWNELVVPGFAGLELLLQNHDSLIAQYDSNRRAEVIPEVLSRLTASVVVNNYEITIPVEASYGPSWGDLEDWKGA